jgi:hypothetical protein
MRKFNVLVISLFVSIFSYGQIKSKTEPLESFSKVVVGPHIEVKFKKSNEESIELSEMKISRDNIVIKNTSGKLEIFLKDARYLSKTSKVDDKNIPIYDGTILTVQLNYKNITKAVVRSREKFFIDHISGERFKLKLYGSPSFEISNLKVDKFTTKIYGESQLNVLSGSTIEQKLKIYGKNEVLLGNNNDQSRIYSFGNNEIEAKVSKKIKLTSLGELELENRGEAEIKKFFSFAEKKE